MAAEQGVVEKLHVRHHVERKFKSSFINLEESFGLFIDGTIRPHHNVRLAAIAALEFVAAAIASKWTLFDLLGLSLPVLRLYDPTLS